MFAVLISDTLVRRPVSVTAVVGYMGPMWERVGGAKQVAVLTEILATEITARHMALSTRYF